MISRSTHLSNVVGQPNVRFLQSYLRLPNRPSRCFLLEGEPGVGKSHSAQCLAADLGCVDDFTGLSVIPASELTIDACRQLFDVHLRHSLLFGGDWKVVVIEELDGVASKAVERFLKVALERLPDRCTVIATSNSCYGIDKALLERFRILSYSCGGPFQESCQDRLAALWVERFGDRDMPSGWRFWGVRDKERFSMRVALARLEEHAELCAME
ncbi:ATP-binding protein [Lignipirellula cremea]|uniref:Replication factor C small subunit n=1 Tax=Lignipirellula cremea TaxID=2528010 RepID=A0A518DTL8_9BACT|nr:ATP-binding protein [Lignipirellula cremea]QDU95173.1 replication factor C small subunit [Lignipirellula cremea]